MKKICFYILIFSFLNYVGCYSSRNVNKELLFSQDLEEPISIVAIITNDDKKIELRKGIYEEFGDTLYTDGIKQYIDHVEPTDVKVVLDEGQYDLVGDTLYVNGINKTNTTVYGQPIDLKIALDDIRYIEIEELDGWATTGCVIGAAAALALSLLAAIAVSSYKSPKKCSGPEGFGFKGGKD